MTCAKLQVRCTIVAPDGRRFVGTNDCAVPQEVCPRSPGEGYSKCLLVCRQDGHAETVALARAGDAARGAHAYVEGHTYSCRNCQEALYAAGVVAITVGPPRAPPYAIGSDHTPGLSKLVEEAGEVGQVGGKIMGVGHMGQHWDGSDLRIRLEEEIADLIAACVFVLDHNKLSRGRIDARLEQKLAQFEQWHEENRS